MFNLVNLIPSPWVSQDGECLETFPSTSMILNFCFFSSKIIIALCNVPLVRSFTYKYFSIKEKRICTQINSITTDDYISEIISWHHLNDNGGRRPNRPAFECRTETILCLSSIFTQQPHSTWQPHVPKESNTQPLKIGISSM